MGSLSTASQIFGDFEVNITTERRPVLYRFPDWQAGVHIWFRHRKVSHWIAEIENCRKWQTAMNHMQPTVLSLTALQVNGLTSQELPQALTNYCFPWRILFEPPAAKTNRQRGTQQSWEESICPPCSPWRSEILRRWQKINIKHHNRWQNPLLT